MVARTRIAFLAPTPPPVMGPSIATTIVLGAPPPRDLELCHIDTADRRSLKTLGRIDLKNIWDALHTYGRLLGVIATKRPALVYVPISQTTIGFLRDSGTILLASLLRRRSLLHLRGGYFREWYENECGGLMRAWVRFTLRRTHGTIVLGETLKPLFAGLVPDDAIHVVHNGEDYPEFKDLERRFDGEKTILFLGNLIPTKGPGELLRAAPAIQKRHPGTRFVFAGAFRDTGFQEWAQQFVAEHGVNVEFTGPVDRPRKVELLKEADLLVFPTYYRNEGQPWVIVEAMAAGLPIVSTDHGCIREMVVDGYNGRLVTKGDADEVAEAVAGLLDRPEELAAMSSASRTRHAERFTREHFRRRLFHAMRVAAGRASTEAPPLTGGIECA